MLWDYNHSINVRLGNATDLVELVPSTSLEDLLLMHKDCKGCYSRHGTRWTPDVLKAVGHNKTTIEFDFMYALHFYEAKLTGNYWMVNMCLDSPLPKCALDLIVFAVERATPWYSANSDGYLGLAPLKSTTVGKNEANRNNVMEQMHKHKMIDKKVFGVHTHMFNTTEDPSQIRFGGYNEELIRDGHDLVWFNTSNQNAWSIEIFSGGLHIDIFSNKTMHAIVDPAYPYIAMPKHAFAKFAETLKFAYPDEPVTCNGADWCYFFTPCDQVAEFLPDLWFKAKTSDGQFVDLRVPPKSFLYPDTDY